MADRPKAAEVAQLLGERAEQLCHDMLSNGRRNGRYWKVGGVDNSRGRSMWVHVAGPKRGSWQDGSTGEFGDALDLVAACRYGGRVKDAYEWALDWLGLAKGGTAPAPRAPLERKPEIDPDRDARRHAALSLWLKGEALLFDTPVEQYLKGRDIDLRRHGRQPAALRYHPSLYHADARRHFPAMVAAISGETGEHIATHRTWIDRDATGRWTKAPVSNAKMTFGDFAGGSIRIWRGASQKPLKDAPDDEPVIICEGIETSLSVAQAMPELRVLCGISLGNLGAIWLPPQISLVVLCAEDDDHPKAREAFQRAANRHWDAGRHVRMARAGGGRDFNDVLRQGKP